MERDERQQQKEYFLTKSLKVNCLVMAPRCPRLFQPTGCDTGVKSENLLLFSVSDSRH